LQKRVIDCRAGIDVRIWDTCALRDTGNQRDTSNLGFTRDLFRDVGNRRDTRNLTNPGRLRDMRDVWDVRRIWDTCTLRDTGNQRDTSNLGFTRDLFRDEGNRRGTRSLTNPGRLRDMMNIEDVGIEDARSIEDKWFIRDENER
jgi:hypothetical protein